MNEPENPTANSGRDTLRLRHVLTIVLVGAALGVGFNAMQLAADPSRALTWVKSERRVVTLERLAQDPPATTPGALTPLPAATTPAAPPAVAPAPARVDTARRTVTPAKGQASVAAPAKAVAPPVTPAIAAPAPAAAAPVADLPVIPDSRDPIEAGLDVAQKFHAAGAAVFLDARSAEEYAGGHIAGAINLPFDDVFKNPALAKAVDAKGRVIVSYCDGGDCDLSRSLAFSLIDAGFRKVLVFTGGMAAWNAAGKPVHKGAQP